jgi:hypothetical protein
MLHAVRGLAESLAGVDSESDTSLQPPSQWRPISAGNKNWETANAGAGPIQPYSCEDKVYGATEDVCAANPHMPTIQEVGATPAGTPAKIHAVTPAKIDSVNPARIDAGSALNATSVDAQIDGSPISFGARTDSDLSLPSASSAHTVTDGSATPISNGVTPLGQIGANRGSASAFAIANLISGGVGANSNLTSSGPAPGSVGNLSVSVGTANGGDDSRSHYEAKRKLQLSRIDEGTISNVVCAARR